MYPTRIVPFWTVLLISQIPSETVARNIVLVVSLPYNLSLALDIVLTGPAFDLAAENSAAKYGNSLNVSIVYLYNASHRNCLDLAADTGRTISEYYYQHSKPDTCYAVISSGCNDQTAMGSLTKEFDWILFSGGPTNDRVIPPGRVAVGGTIYGYAKVVLEILTFYEWLHVTILTESNASTPFYGDVGSILQENARTADMLFALEIYAVDCQSTDAIERGLRAAKKRSRVIILLTTGIAALKILNATAKTNMANGEYVFFNIQPLQSVPYGSASQFDHTFSDETIGAFRSLLFLAYRPAGAALVRGLDSAIRERSRTSYGDKYRNITRPLSSYAVRSSYDVVELFAATVNDSATGAREKENCGGLRLAQKMTNRTFSLSTGDLLVSPKRARNLDLDIFAYNQTTKKMQTIGTYEWTRARRLTWSKELNIDWPSADGKAPRDIPLCGFSGSAGQCAARVMSLIVTTVVAVGVVALFLAGTTLLIRCYAISAHAKSSDDYWWILECSHLVPFTVPTS